MIHCRVAIPSGLYREVMAARYRFRYLSYDGAHPLSLSRTISLLLKAAEV